ncbi:MAG: PSD1 and planctomycete cytochrome C domain-containing protein [Isosphaeraceae bacterium]
MITKSLPISAGFVLLWAALSSGADPVGPPAVEEHGNFFEARIRPILADHCTSCHGPKKQEAGLRLDSREGLLKGADSGPVVDPGQPGASPLVEAVEYAGPTRMPPKGKLPDQAIKDLTEWVRLGARWPESRAPSKPDPARSPDARSHWAFQLVRDPRPPAVQQAEWCTTSVDPFILARLEAKGLAPSPRADKRALIRRATFDLTGLPPSPEEIAAFLSDPSPEAFTHVVDRLLASPHYGERWARHWLDVSRYSDTRGYVFFQDASFHWAYTYRDYVIRALNSDLPFDRFVIEQLAADRLVQGDDRRSLPALGFLTLGGRFMNNFHDIVDDRIDVVSRGLLGLTLTCARCHDHKYDPISSRDYYALYGVLGSAEEPTVPPEFQPPPQTEAYRKFVAELRAREAKLTAFVKAKHQELVEGARTRAGDYLLAAQQANDQPSTDEFMLIADGTDLNPKMLLRWQTYLARTRKNFDPVFAPWHALAGNPGPGAEARTREVLRELATANDPARRVNRVVVKRLADAPPRTLAELAAAYGKVLGEVEKLWQETARRAALNRTAPQPLPDPDLEQLRQVFHGPDAPPNLPLAPFGDLALLPDRPSQARFQELRTAVQDWLVKGAGAPPRAISLEDSAQPLDPRVFLRGNPNNLGDAVPRRLPQLLADLNPEPFREGSGRLEFARAIVDPRNPLTTRVLVNRVWMHHFGRPLVATPGDFGLRSDPPSHPDLLDHLAASFMEESWSLKKLHRRIMLSSAYQQASEDRSEAWAVDPENLLYWRANRRRLDLESMRDALLAVSGRLDRGVGGPSFAGVTDPSARRRTIYAHIDRLTLPGIFRTFDFPDPNATSPRRDQTTVAPQALFFMNHPFVRTAAEALAGRPDVIGLKDPGARLERLFRLAYGRPPTPEESSLARAFLSAEPVPWVSFCQALLLGNEFAFID